MYNKRQFKKLNDKKLLHKVHKHWVTISIALLSLLGGGTVATHVNVNADTNNQANHQLSTDANMHISHNSLKIFITKLKFYKIILFIVI